MSKYDISHLFKEKKTIKLSEDKTFTINTSIKTYMEYKKEAQSLQNRIDNNGAIEDDLEATNLIIKHGLGEAVLKNINELPNISLEALNEICFSIMSAWTGKTVDQIKELTDNEINKELEKAGK